VSIRSIDNPLPGERVVALSPENSSAAAVTWLRRPNLFAGRALTAPTLAGRQRWEAGRIALRGQAFTPGVVRGLHVGYVVREPDGAGSSLQVRLAIDAGGGLAPSGEDVVLVRPVDVDLFGVPVVAPPDVFAGGSGGGAGDGSLRARAVGMTLGEMLQRHPGVLPPVGILVLQPVNVDVAEVDPNDPCDICACGEAGDNTSFEDWRIGDGVRVLWYAWPSEWRALPAAGPRLRNALAYTVFDAERALAAGQALPWEEFGVPIALIGVDAEFRPQFADRAAVVRQGGRPRDSRLLLSRGADDGFSLLTKPRLPALWQAQIEQLAEQVAELGDTAPAAATLAQAFGVLPPTGLLPSNVLDLATHSSGFFPANFDLDAVPVPLEQIDTAIRSAAALAPLDFSLGERVRVLVPVSQASYEPRLLLQETIAAEFQSTLDGFLLGRARSLGGRQGLRVKIATLVAAVGGHPMDIPAIADDAEALEPESLLPWGPPPSGGGHRCALLAGLHQHFFDGASAVLPIAAGDTLYAWVYLDPDNPPRTLMLQWNDGNWEHRAYWGENLVGWGSDGTASRLHSGDVPALGQWLRMEVPAASVGLAGSNLRGMAFTLYDGRAAFGPSGRSRGSASTDWVSDRLPPGAVQHGDYAWEPLTPNDLWAPFEPALGLAPALRPATGGHRAALLGGLHQHHFDGATATLTVPAGQSIYAWVYLDPANPPRTLMFQFFSGTWEHRVYWGENLIGWGTDATVARARLGDMPTMGRWTRMEIPIASPGLAGQAISGMAFTLFDGRAAFGPAGSLAAGVETPWFADSLPAGAAQHGNYLWEFLAERDLGAPFAPVLGVEPAIAPAGISTAIQALEDAGTLAALSPPERAQLEVRGLEGFIAYLKSRADRADDLVDYGFVKIQTDIYRVRQLMLGSTDATRLAISPALAGIAKAETAVASQQQISDFLKNVYRKTDATVSKAVTPRAPTTTTTGGAGGSSAPRGFSTTGTLSPASTGGTQSKAFAMAALGGTSFAKADIAAPFVRIPIAAPAAQLSATDLIQARSAAAPFVKAVQFTPSDIVNAAPLVGNASIRTVSIAARLTQPPAAEARDYSTVTRHEAMFNLLRLLDELTAEDGGVTPGLFSGIDVHGLADDPFLDDDVSKAARRRPLLDFINPARRVALMAHLLKPPAVPTGVGAAVSAAVPDEATYFSNSADMADNTVALMRQIEGRIKLYRDVVAACERALEGMRSDLSAAQGRLNAWSEKLAEARHDVSVTRALMAEEQARIDATNARRTKVLAEEVRFLAYVRPREFDNLGAAPLRNLDPGLVAAPVPTCLQEHNDVPDELQDMLAVVREAPAAWFGAVPALLDKLDRVDLLVKAVQSTQLRSQITMLRAPQAAFAAIAKTSSAGLTAAVAQVKARQQVVVTQARAAAMQIDLGRLASLTWQGVRGQAEQVVSLGDIIDGGHGRGDVARRAAAIFDQIGQIGACLHAEFSAVLPSIRLDWAERLSEYDDAPALRNLASLPRWSEIDYVDRKQMQAYADWLFDQIRVLEPRAESLMNDVIRMCLLLASHAPVDRIIAGRMARPVTARPGVRIPLTAFEPGRLRVGMQALVYRAGAVVASAMVEDIGGKEISARVVHTVSASVELDDQVRVHFAEARTVLLATPQRSLFAGKKG